MDTFQADFNRQKQEAKDIVQRLEVEQANMKRQMELQQCREGDLAVSSERRQKLLANRLTALEEEHNKCQYVYAVLAVLTHVCPQEHDLPIEATK